MKTFAAMPQVCVCPSVCLESVPCLDLDRLNMKLVITEGF